MQDILVAPILEANTELVDITFPPGDLLHCIAITGSRKQNKILNV